MPGKWVINSNGKWAILPGGKWAISNSSEKCQPCCGVCTPYVRIVFSGVSPNLCHGGYLRDNVVTECGFPEGYRVAVQFEDVQLNGEWIVPLLTDQGGESGEDYQCFYETAHPWELGPLITRGWFPWQPLDPPDPGLNECAETPCYPGELIDDESQPTRIRFTRERVSGVFQTGIEVVQGETVAGFADDIQIFTGSIAGDPGPAPWIFSNTSPASGSPGFGSSTGTATVYLA